MTAAAMGIGGELPYAALFGAVTSAGRLIIINTTRNLLDIPCELFGRNFGIGDGVGGFCGPQSTLSLLM